MSTSPDTETKKPRRVRTSAQTRPDGNEPTKLSIINVPAPVWIAIITGIVAIVTAYWQFVYKPGPGPAQPTSSETQKYTGRVVDARTNKAIHNAKVSIEVGQDVPQVLNTDSEGVFHALLRAPVGAARIRVEAEGYDTFDRNVSFSRSGIEPVMLSPVASTPTPVPRFPVQRVPVSRPSAGERRKPTPTPCRAEDMLRGKC
jgi:hypothetical protein